ncbi:uncharacterized protein B0T15DRAFT_577053 [Chaetomium strumarium]|uniref:AAA+ ATPase domain-containing protein n=1 Tax=Chaetomium strumarium TaxID=1170767 RepID=A0AAJ0GPN2_9PEZI|nr:hypothetical protein B0T15DRAFT_577053 [Chaetomium strumarium]
MHKTAKSSVIAHVDHEMDKDRSSQHGDITTAEALASKAFSGAGKLKSFSIPKLAVVPWAEAKVRKQAKRLHFAIEVAYDLPSLNPSVVEDVEEMYMDSDAPMCPINEEWPERIIVNSLRLQGFLEHEFNMTLPASTDEPFHILRPYKMLSYHEGRIRKRIAEFHNARRVMWAASEDEYTEHYQRNPVEDGAALSPQRESQMTLQQLTAYILDFKCLERVIGVCSRPEFREPEHMPAHVLFNNLWLLFPVGSLVYARDPKVPQKIWKVVERTSVRRDYEPRSNERPGGRSEDPFSDFVAICYHLDFDGTCYQPSYHEFRINSFDGPQLMLSLLIAPLSFVEYQGILDRGDVLERAKRFKAMTRVRHQSYSGRSYDSTPTGKRLTELDDGSHKNSGVRVAPLADNPWDMKSTEDLVGAETKKWKEWGKDPDLSGPTEEQDLLLPDRCTKYWGSKTNIANEGLSLLHAACLQIGKDIYGNPTLTNVQQTDEPWQNLELPTGHKETVHSLVDSHFSKDRSKNMHFDLGVIILLHGVPGAGKTSTAECVAQSHGRPLLPITCGDLGLTPAGVESKLQEIFRLAEAWGCVMLFDEADVFLAQRTPTDIERNALVSETCWFPLMTVFLRTLEYYEGILFLTTNRVGAFDEAFKSRIHMSLYCPPLTEKLTISIWRSHIATAQKDSRIELDAVDLVLCAQEIFQRQRDPQFGPVWNGRQIRNAFQTAVALAGFHSKDNERIKLERKYFTQVFNVSAQFSNYVWSVKQRNSDAQWNAMLMLRRDDFAYTGPPGADPAGNQQLMVPVNQQGGGQVPRSGNFPQSSFGQQAGPPRTTAPFNGGMGVGGMNMNMNTNAAGGGSDGNQFGSMLSA